MQAYMKSTMPFRGVGARELKKLCREVFAAHPLPDEGAWLAAVHELWDGATYREERYAAIALTQHPRYREYQQPRTLDLYRELVASGSWWDLVDPLATRNVGAVLLAHPEQTTSVIMRWAGDEELWLRRTAILCQLHHRQHTDLELLRHVIERNLEGSLHGAEFFVRKAIGWALRQYARTDAGWASAFVEEHRDQLSGLSRREALKHLGTHKGVTSCTPRDEEPGLGRGGTWRNRAT
jgi:3-methyladenine DNA glycosylase AlkD